MQWHRGWARAIVIVGSLLSWSTAISASPSEQEPSPRVAGLARSIMSPFCPGRTLQSCPSPEASRWVADIREWTAQGRSDEQILQRLQARVPGFALAGPPASTGWLLGLVPVAAASLVLLLVVRRLLALRAQARAVERDRAPAPTGDPALDALLDDELRETD
jgi:cytochrome c-type biogenesis protein CcmH/NrfF